MTPQEVHAIVGRMEAVLTHKRFPLIPDVQKSRLTLNNEGVSIEFFFGIQGPNNKDFRATDPIRLVRPPTDIRLGILSEVQTIDSFWRRLKVSLPSGTLVLDPSGLCCPVAWTNETGIARERKDPWDYFSQADLTVNVRVGMYTPNPYSFDNPLSPPDIFTEAELAEIWPESER